MPARDARGLPLSTDVEQAAARYRAGVDQLLSLWPDTGDVLDAAITADPGFALAHAARARFAAIRADLPTARQCIAVAAAAVAARGTERERSHVAILGMLMAGQSGQALPAAQAHVERWPRDVLILSTLLGPFGLFAFSGMRDHDQAKVDLCERHAAAFDADDWWFLTYRGWSLAEVGDTVRGRDYTERGLELRRLNANAAHALVHVMHEAGSGDEAAALVDGWLPCYGRQGPLHGHIGWHGALVALAKGDVPRALAIYTDSVVPARSVGAPINIVSDTASFLWRLRVDGHPVPADLLDQATGFASGHFAQPGFAFADVHKALLDALAGDRVAVQRRADALEELVTDNRLAAGSVVPAVCRGLLSFADGDFAGCVQWLAPVAGDVARIGGSGAQRELIADTMLAALLRSGDVVRARPLLDERLHRRPSRRDSLWLAAIS
jgi:hypothetical protein